MKVEIYKDIFWRVVAFRKDWGVNPKTMPIQYNVYEIRRSDFIDLVLAIDHYAILCKEKEADFISWNLFLKVIDNAAYNVKKELFLDSVRK